MRLLLLRLAMRSISLILHLDGAKLVDGLATFAEEALQQSFADRI